MRLGVIGVLLAAMFAVAITLGNVSAEKPAWAVPAHSTCQILVCNQNGDLVTLSVAKRPILFFAEWCPHCQAFLRQLSGLPENERPVLVDTFYDGAPPVAATKTVLADEGMPGESFYLNPIPPLNINRVPTMLVEQGGNVVIMSDEYGMLEACSRLR